MITCRSGMHEKYVSIFVPPFHPFLLLTETSWRPFCCSWLAWSCPLLSSPWRGCTDPKGHQHLPLLKSLTTRLNSLPLANHSTRTTDCYSRRHTRKAASPYDGQPRSRGKWKPARGDDYEGFGISITTKHFPDCILKTRALLSQRHPLRVRCCDRGTHTSANSFHGKLQCPCT